MASSSARRAVVSTAKVTTTGRVTTTVKRKVEESETSSDVSSNEPPAKRMFPIFAKPSESERVDQLIESSGPLRWKQSPFLPSTCLYAENLNPEVRTKIAAFDLDGTVIKFSRFLKDTEWHFWHKNVPQFLKETHDSGNTIVFFSNQFYPEKRLKVWRSKVQDFAKALPDIPFILFAATARDAYRKPMPGMWVAVEKIAKAAGATIDKQSSFFVGDAAGRKGDFAGTDRKFADNLCLKFLTPEEYFLKQPPQPYELKGTHVSAMLRNEGPSIIPTSSPILPANSKQPEMVLFVGPPASGKTSLFESTFSPAGYVHVNQDTLGSRPKCLKAAEESLRNGISCVVDNTNRDKKTRQFYVNLAKSLSTPIRCFNFNVSQELAWHNNLYRSFCLPLISEGTEGKDRKLLPFSAFTSFTQGYEEPTIEEGFGELKTVNWQFQGDAEKERYWKMWLQIDGK